MTDNSRPIANLAHQAALSGGDTLVLVNGAGQPRLANVETAFSNTTTPLPVGRLILANSSTPANSTITCRKGEFWFDATYLYVATSDNSLKRVALSSF